MGNGNFQNWQLTGSETIANFEEPEFVLGIFLGHKVYPIPTWSHMAARDNSTTILYLLLHNFG